jgi:hypothetical protein
MSIIFHHNDPCPKCHKPITQTVIEPHPTRRDLALHNFHCADCDPIKTNILSLTPAKPSQERAA